MEIEFFCQFRKSSYLCIPKRWKNCHKFGIIINKNKLRYLVIKKIKVGERMKLRRDESGIVMMGIYEFLAEPRLLET